MDHLRVFPVVATLPDGSIRKPVHVVVGPGLDTEGNETDGAPARTIIWAWSAALGKPFPLLDTDGAPELVPARADRWTLTTPEGTWHLRYSRGASCCGEPLRRWRPPGVGAARRSATA
jgi:hypothetical protein